MKRRKALIVGAGIAGPVAGMWLQRIGCEVSIVEARDSVARSEGAFLGVAPNGMNVLAALGVMDDSPPARHPCEGFRFANKRGESIGAIDRRGDVEAFGQPLTMMRRGDLNAWLAACAEKRGLDVAYGRRVVAIDESDPRSVGVTFSDGTQTEADFVVGCDGLRSIARQVALPDAPAPSFSGMLDVGGFARVPDFGLEPGINLMVFGARAFFGAFNTHDGETWWFHNGPDLPITDLRAHLLALHAGDPAWIGDVIRATDVILGPWKLHEMRSMPRWSNGRVCLVGDAAHAMSPSAGQGASLAMEDAMVLAQCLRDHDEVRGAFETFERLRRPRVDAIAKAAAQQSSNKVPGPVSSWFRDRMLPMFLKLGAAQQARSYAFRVEWERAV